jgi:hypothetical protein
MQSELGARMQSLDREEIFHQHPIDPELQSYCEKLATSPESIDDDKFQKFEGHLDVCERCFERARSFEMKLKGPAKVPNGRRLIAGQFQPMLRSYC